MWSFFWGVKSLSKQLRWQRRTTQKAAKRHTNCRMWSVRQEATKLCGQARIKSHGQTMWSEQRTAPFLPPQVLYCSSSSSGCQGPLKIKIRTQNLIRSKQRKASSRSFPSSSHKALVHTWRKWSHFVFQEQRNSTRNQKLICSKQRKDTLGSNHIQVSRYVGAYINDAKHRFADFEKIKRSCNLFRESSWFL